MKCLTVRQPFAWAIMTGAKLIENRTWATAYRGPLAIHAGKSRSYLDDTAPEDWYAIMPGLPDFASLDYGKIVAVANVVGCVPLEKVAGRPFAEGPWCWLLAEVRRIEPITWTGAQGLFDVPDAVIDAALRDIGVKS